MSASDWRTNKMVFLGRMLYDMDWQDFVDVGLALRRMIVELGKKYYDFSPYNILYNVREKSCRLYQGNGRERVDDLIQKRWYPRVLWESLDQLYYEKDYIITRIILEGLYRQSPFHDDDDEVYRSNIRTRSILDLPENCLQPEYAASFYMAVLGERGLPETLSDVNVWEEYQRKFPWMREAVRRRFKNKEREKGLTEPQNEAGAGGESLIELNPEQDTMTSSQSSEREVTDDDLIEYFGGVIHWDSRMTEF